MRRNRNKIIVVLLILLISIGFAFLSSNLSIIGNTLISKQTWDIHFENPTKVGGNMTASNLELTNSTTVDFTVDLLQPRDSYEFTVDVVNDGSVDGMINSITATELTTNQKKLFEYVITYDDGAALKEKQKLAAHDIDKYKVTVRYKDDISNSDLSTTNTTVDIEIHVEYVKADSTAINRVKNSFISLYNQTTPGVLAQGDEVNIGDEHFYIISEDTNKYVLLSKYNLNVGKYKITGTEGVQNKKAFGITDDGLNSNATVPFSSKSYWLDTNNELIGTYTYNALNINIYDFTKNGSDGDNYSIAYYINNYVAYLNETLHSEISKGRLMSYDEAISFGCGLGNCNNAPKFIISSTYWLSDLYGADDLTYVWFVRKNGLFGYGSYKADYVSGVRPVIEVSKQYL